MRSETSTLGVKKITILQSSLREASNTSIVCKLFEQKCLEKWLEVHYIDLREKDLQFCDARDQQDYNEDMQTITKAFADSQAIIFGMPVYQYSMSGVLKNILDVCGDGLDGKSIGAMVIAGWPVCYMASRDLLDCLYYEYGCTNIAPTPYAWSMDFKDGKLVSEKVLSKLDELVGKIISL